MVGELVVLQQPVFNGVPRRLAPGEHPRTIRLSSLEAQLGTVLTQMWSLGHFLQNEAQEEA